MSKNIDASNVLYKISNQKKVTFAADEFFYFLNVFKPRGITSFDVIHKLRKRLNIKKMGHSGTLDPEAEGVMQIGVGKATRLLDYLGSDKKYIAKIRFGYFSSTLDSEGDIIPFNTPKFSYDELFAAINSMLGEIEQTPPAYSAIKVGGKKLCDIARKNAKKAKDAFIDIDGLSNKLIGVEIPKRIVKIHEAKLLNFITIDNPDDQKNKIPFEAEIEIFCSKGTYIRTFAFDLARKLGTSAYLISLKRTMAGKFDINDSVQIDDVVLNIHGIKPHQAIDLPIYELDTEEYKKVLNGVSFAPKIYIPQNQTMMLLYKNILVSIAILSDNMIVCKKVFK